MLGAEAWCGYCLEMICADFRAGGEKHMPRSCCSAPRWSQASAITAFSLASKNSQLCATVAMGGRMEATERPLTAQWRPY